MLGCELDYYDYRETAIDELFANLPDEFVEEDFDPDWEEEGDEEE
jgi:hypothetical protein